MDNSTPSGLICRQRCWHVGHVTVGILCPIGHLEITSIRSLVEAHSSVTPGQGAERPQPGELGEQGKSASKRLTSISDAHSQCTLPSRTAHPSIVVAAPFAGLASKNKRIICNACNNPPPNSRDARSSVRTNEQPNRIRSLTYVDKHNLLIIFRLYDGSGAVSKVRFWPSLS